MAASTFFRYLFFEFSAVIKQVQENSLERTHEITCFCFAINSFHKDPMGKRRVPSLLQRENRGSEKSDVSKVLFPDIGKINNHTSW